MSADVTSAQTSGGQLGDVISAAFGIDELEALCFELGIDPENVPHKDAGKGVWVRHIVVYFTRRHALDKLLARCREMRPNAPWDQVNTEPVSELDDSAATATTLQELLRKPDVLKKVADLNNVLSDARAQHRSLRYFKELHDQLHKLQFSFCIPVLREQNRFPSDAQFMKDLESYGQAFFDIVDALVDMLKQNEKVLHRERSWIKLLEQYVEMFDRACKSADEKQLGACLERVHEIIGVQPAVINGRLKDAARSMSLSDPFSGLSELYEKLSQARLDADSQARLNNFKEGIQETQAMWKRLGVLVEEHDAWQEAEDQLKRLETDPFARLRDEYDGWVKLKEKLDPLCQTTGERWALRLLEDAEKLQVALDAAEPDRVVEVFGSYRMKAGLRFFSVDTKLLQECGQISEIGTKLDVLLQAA